MTTNKQVYTILLAAAVIAGSVTMGSAYAIPFVGTPFPALAPLFGTLINFDDQATGTPVLPNDYADEGIASITETEGVGTFARYGGSQSPPNYIGTGFNGDRGDNGSGWDGTILIECTGKASQVGIGIANNIAGPETISVYDESMVLLESIVVTPGSNVYVGFDRIGVHDIKFFEINGDFFAIDDLQHDCSVIEIDKFYTFTNNDFSDDRCDEVDVTTGECLVEPRRPNVNIDDDIWADNLPQTDDVYVLLGDEKKNKTVVNPGQYIAVSTVDVPYTQTVTVFEDFSECLDIGTVNPNKVPGGVQVALILSNGDVLDIDDDLALGNGGSIVLTDNDATVVVENAPEGSQVRVMVKFQPTDELGVIGNECTNTQSATGDDATVSATADLTIEQKP